ncbi:MAG: hypothetical protein PHU85_01210 [Phycisphaerae bacterium]|nr:hypothetical protein [Phycisphaerae bacterium]
MSPRRTRLLLLAIAVPLAGCAGRGWARIEPLASLSLNDTRIFDRTQAFLAAPIDRYHPIRPMMLTGKAEVESVEGDVIRTWLLLAYVAPSDVPGRVNVVAMVARQDHSKKPVWRFYGGSGDVEFWQYARHCMIYGNVRPANKDELDLTQQVFSACVTGAANFGRFRKEAGKLLAELDRVREGLPADSDIRAEIDEATRSMRKVMGVGKPAKTRKGRGD